jgi:predicted nucleic acid-binding protein
MNLYLDSSAIVKIYIAEAGSKEVSNWISDARMVSTSLISRAEVSAAIARATRMNVFNNQEGRRAIQAFQKDWFDFIRLPILEATVAKADELAWQYYLRGYDAVHLAVTLLWQETIGEIVTLATFDQELQKASIQSGLSILPKG